MIMCILFGIWVMHPLWEGVRMSQESKESQKAIELPIRAGVSALCAAGRQPQPVCLTRAVTSLPPAHCLCQSQQVLPSRKALRVPDGAERPFYQQQRGEETNVSKNRTHCPSVCDHLGYHFSHQAAILLEQEESQRRLSRSWEPDCVMDTNHP